MIVSVAPPTASRDACGRSVRASENLLDAFGKVSGGLCGVASKCEEAWDKRRAGQGVANGCGQVGSSIGTGEAIDVRWQGVVGRVRDGAHAVPGDAVLLRPGGEGRGFHVHGVGVVPTMQVTLVRDRARGVGAGEQRGGWLSGGRGR